MFPTCAIAWMKPMPMGRKVNYPTAPFWHNYSKDKFFSHFNCFSILPSYANGGNDEIASNLPQRSINKLQLDTFQLSSVMRQLEQFRSKYQTEVHTVPIPDQSAATKSICVPFVAGDAGSKGQWISAMEFIRKGVLGQDTSTNNGGFSKMPKRRGGTPALWGERTQRRLAISWSGSERGQFRIYIRQGWTVYILYIWVQITSGSLKKYRWHPDEVQNPFSGQNEAVLCLEVCS